MGPLLAVLFVSMVLQSPAVPSSATPTEKDDQNKQQQRSAPRQENPPPPGKKSGKGSLDDIISIESIRKELEHKPTLTFTMPDPNKPHYRVEIRAYDFKMPDFKESFKIPKPPVPQPLGGADHYEMMRLITPPQYWGSAPFTNGDLLKMSALSGAYGLAGALVKKALDARDSAAAARARQEVQQELADIAAHNARVVAGEADPDGAAAAEKKKQEAAKKKQQKKKIREP